VSKPKVLFVDDEPRILDGLRRSLRAKRGEWDMSFAPGGEPALEVLAGAPHDVIVSDMRMPGMDGAELLTRVSTLYPEVARVVLSGQAEAEAAIPAFFGRAPKNMELDSCSSFAVRPVSRATAFGNRPASQSCSVRAALSSATCSGSVGNARAVPAIRRAWVPCARDVFTIS
jgi:DNA-binding NtrC family response regulator